jgi:cell division protein ZapE
VALQGTADPLDVLARKIAKKYRLICFDEFHVADITDALILHRLLRALFNNGVGLVTTSNFRPDDLYPDGLHRERILPAIALLKEQLEVINVDNGTDYRHHSLAQVQRYHWPHSAQTQVVLADTFASLADAADEDPLLLIEGRELPAQRRAGSVVWFDFKTLCAGARSQNDYLEIAGRFDTLLLSEVPRMSAQMGSEARRFTLLVDVLYDRHVKLIMSAAVPAHDLYTAGPLAHEFGRTVSRLREMQSGEFLALQRRLVDTSLTFKTPAVRA